MISINKIVANSIVITTGPVVKETTVFKHSPESGLPVLECDIVGELLDSHVMPKEDLVEVEIGSHVTSLGYGAFSDCTGLTKVMIPDSVTSIGEGAFLNCTSLTSIMIPDSVTSIGLYPFWNCSGLTSVTIPDSITSIGDDAFGGCSGLTSVTIVATGKPGASAANVKQAMIDAGVDPNITWNMPS